MPKSSGNGQSIILTPQQLKIIKQQLPYKYQVLFDIMYFTGSRVSECVAIRRVDVVNGIIVIRKSNTKGKVGTREIPIPPHLIQAIDKLPNENAFLFSGRNGEGHLTRYSVDKILRNVCEKLGIEGFSTHGFRRSFITNLARNNIHMKLIMKCSGHKQLSSVEKYIETTEEEKIAAVSTLW
jgi:integrase/recombinase XerD